jgi:diamine N-acetyltransferase
VIAADSVVATMQLRPASLLDIPAIADLERTPAWRSLVGNWSLEEHHDRMSDSDCRYLVAEPESGELAGFAILRGLSSPHLSIRLQRIVVAAPGNGIGRFIMTGILDSVFRELRAHRLWLDVLQANRRAQRLCEGLGFRREGSLRDAIYRDGQFQTLILMSMLYSDYSALYAERNAVAA